MRATSTLRPRSHQGNRRHPRHRWPVAALAATMAIALGACGSSSGPSASHHASTAGGVSPTTTSAPSATVASTTPASDPLSDQSLSSIDAELNQLDQSLAQADTDASSSQGDS
ncbi:MAG TPA: hypothetical protein VKR22_10530 [Acidimicrobiales bacterium]|nr:hypothetical protein [Acidimicrobiales bacterium]